MGKLQREGGIAQHLLCLHPLPKGNNAPSGENRVSEAMRGLQTKTAEQIREHMASLNEFKSQRPSELQAQVLS